MSHDEIAKNLSEEYDAPVEDIHRDINEFIQQLNNLHVIGQ
jgi:hypothetical protein